MWAKEYISQRLRIGSFFFLACLFALFLFEKDQGFEVYSLNVLLMFTGFLVFRMVDDAGSRSIDLLAKKNHLHLQDSVYPLFKKSSQVLNLIYLLFFAFYNFKLFVVLSLYTLVSHLVYSLFPRSNTMIQGIALLKYPLLIWVAAGLTHEWKMIALMIVSFFIMLCYDLFEIQNGLRKFIILTPLLLLCGFLVFNPLESWSLIFFILIPIFALLLFYKKQSLKLLLPLYYPIAYFILNLLN